MLVFTGPAEGTTRGRVPSARIAAYKVCNFQGCQSSSILSGFDDAIANGVDLITISIRGNGAYEFEEDPIAFGAFHAMAKGILTINSTGNSSPKLSSVSSVAPWMFSVVAITTDCLIVDNIILGTGNTVVPFHPI
ncbi:hypothetical protein EZV62_001363 [Acer yangbiense]|uniref:Peptidase S8/S53 domain-containing protein n=1 Tax=Acer yangbiense TaxID=1000413 RepID=A0A5C7IV96_9ROSI|nr:hypothetical protein EZV62_001363 [Acer yangbiense]